MSGPYLSVLAVWAIGAELPADPPAECASAEICAATIIRLGRTDGRADILAGEFREEFSEYATDAEALALWAKGSDPRAAADRLDRVVTAHPEAGLPRVLAGGLRMESGDYEAALDTYEPLVQQAPPSVWAWGGTIICLDNLRRRSELRTMLHDIPDPCRRDHTTLLIILRVAAHIGEWGIALDAYKSRCAILGLKAHPLFLRWARAAVAGSLAIGSLGFVVAVANLLAGAALLAAATIVVAGMVPLRKHMLPWVRRGWIVVSCALAVYWLAAPILATAYQWGP